jgi:hypothetical protein
LIGDHPAERKHADVLADHLRRAVNMARPHDPGWKLYRFILAWFVQLMKQTATFWPKVLVAVHPVNVEPNIWLYALSRQLQHPPAFADGGAEPIPMPGAGCCRHPGGQHKKDFATFFTPRTQRSGRPASSPTKIVVEVPSMIWSMDTGPNPGRRLSQLNTPARRLHPRLPPVQCDRFP